MKSIRYKLGKTGLLLAVMSVTSMGLSIFNYDVKLFSWVEVLGNTMSWIIRGFIILGGFSLYIFYEDTAGKYKRR